MKNYLTKNNVRQSLEEVIKNNSLTGINIEEFTTDVYNYAVKCKTEKCFTEKDSIMLIKKHTTVSREIIIDFWSVIVMYCLENLANKLVNYISNDVSTSEEMKTIAMYTLYDAAKHYDFNNEYRRHYEASIEEFTLALAPQACKFMTYATGSLVNNLRRFNRQQLPIHSPDKKAKLVAFISMILDKEKGNVTPKQMAELVCQNAEELKISAPKKNDLKKQKNFELFIWNLMDVCNTNAAWKLGIDDEFELHLIKDNEYNPENLVIEEESRNAVNIALPRITAEVYGYESAYITQMKAANMSFYKMETPFRRFRMINQYLDSAASENNELLPLLDNIKLSICTYGEKGALSMVTSPMASQYLSAAINHANALMEEIKRGERTVKECIGSDCPAGSLNYMFSKIFPKKKGDMAVSNLAKSKEYRRALKNAGLDFLADAIAANI